MTLKLAASARWFAASPSSSSSPAAARCAGSAFARGASPLSLDYPSRAFPFARRTPSSHGGMMNSAVGGAPFPVFDMEEGKKAAAVASRYIPVKGHRALAKLRDSRAVKVGHIVNVFLVLRRLLMVDGCVCYDRSAARSRSGISSRRPRPSRTRS